MSAGTFVTFSDFVFFLLDFKVEMFVKGKPIRFQLNDVTEKLKLLSFIISDLFFCHFFGEINTFTTRWQRFSSFLSVLCSNVCLKETLSVNASCSRRT